MDLLQLLQCIPSWSVYLTLVIVLLYVYYREVYIKTFSRRLGQPGPLPYPIVGYLPFYIEKGFIACHEEWVRTYGKVVGLSYNTTRSMLVAEPDLLREVLTRYGSNVFVDRHQPFLTDTFLDHNLFSQNGERWRHVRNILSPTFSTGKLRMMTELVQQSTETLINNMRKLCEKNEAFDAKDLFGNFTMDTIAATACGIKIDAQNNPDEPILKAAKTVLDMSNLGDPVLLISILFPSTRGLCRLINKVRGQKSLSETVAFFGNLADQLVEERKRDEHSEKNKDFLQLTINANREIESEQGDKNTSTKGMTREETNSNIALFFLAGFDNTSQGLQFLAYLLATHPEWQDKVIQEVDEVLQGAKPNYDNIQKLNVLDMCLSESHRLYPPGFLIQRKATEDITIDGHFFAKGTVVSVPVWQIQHDPEYYPDPELFNPGRFTPEAKQARHPYTYMPFGMGPRNCIGMRLALMEMKMAMAMIFQNYKFLTCEKTQIPLVISKKNPIRPEEGVWLKLSALS